MAAKAGANFADFFLLSPGRRLRRIMARPAADIDGGAAKLQSF